MARRQIPLFALFYYLIDLMFGLFGFIGSNITLLYSFLYALFPFLNVEEEVYRLLDSIYLAVLTYLLITTLRKATKKTRSRRKKRK